MQCKTFYETNPREGDAVTKIQAELDEISNKFFNTVDEVLHSVDGEKLDDLIVKSEELCMPSNPFFKIHNAVYEVLECVDEKKLDDLIEKYEELGMQSASYKIHNTIDEVFQSVEKLDALIEKSEELCMQCRKFFKINPKEADAMTEIDAILDEIGNILYNRTDAVLKSEEKLDDLVVKSEEHCMRSKPFFKIARKINSWCVVL